MRGRFKESAVPLWAIFCAVCILILRSYQIADPNLVCEEIHQQDIHEMCSSFSFVKNPSSPALVTGPPFPSHPFVEGQPKLVVILTYQRSGSTFFGEFFNQNQDAFYMFEPLDSLYSAIYGTRQAWNVPSDITNYKNGSQRNLPPEEIQMVSQFLYSLLTCDVASLPTETLLHRFFVQFSLEFLTTNKYVQCVMKFLIRTSKCNALAPYKFCGGRFGNKSEEVLTDCRRAMTDEDYRSRHPNSSMFEKYFNCTKPLREFLDEKCTPFWQASCSSQQLRAVKLVRGTMDSMEPLLRALPNLRVIHLIRDPRALVLSRYGFDASARGLFSERDRSKMVSREALLYCRTVVRDVNRRKDLEALYPGKVITIIYDDVVRDAKGYIRRVYEWLGLPASEDAFCWLRKSMYPKHYGGRLNSTAIASRWQNVITAKQKQDIDAACEEFFQVVEYNWASRHVTSDAGTL